MARPRQISDEQIDAAARATFVEHGRTAPVSLVARRLGVTHTAVLQRAGSKEKLLLRSLSPGRPWQVLVARLAAPPRPQAVRLQLEVLLCEVLAFHEQMLPGLMVLRSGGPAAPVASGHEPPTLLLRRLLKAWLVRGASIVPGRAAITAEALLGAVEARCFNAYLGGSSFVTGTSQHFVHRLVTGLLPELSFPSMRSGSR
jgi:AcrR family transcriptional regulator